MKLYRIKYELYGGFPNCWDEQYLPNIYTDKSIADTECHKLNCPDDLIYPAGRYSVEVFQSE